MAENQHSHDETVVLDLGQKIEALLFVADAPMTLAALAQATQSNLADVRDCVYRLQADYDGELAGPERGFELRAVARGYRLYVREALDPLISEHYRETKTQRLSTAALETLAVIAYKQPITRAGVAEIRAVNVDSVVRTLVSRDLLTEVGQDDETGATLYGTTPTLLQYLGISDLSELPQISPLIEDNHSAITNEQH